MSSVPINNSNKISENAVRTIFKFSNVNLENMNLLNTLNYIIRKLTHLFSYMSLSILLYLHFIKQNKSNKKIITIILILLITFAVSDEIHQYYVPGRTCRITDILIDTSGVFLGIIIMQRKNNKFSYKKR